MKAFKNGLSLACTAAFGVALLTAAPPRPLLAATAQPAAPAMEAHRDADAVRAVRGLAITPVPVNVRGLDRQLVGLGSYLVNAGGGCNDCHTSPPYAPGGDPYKGQPTRINKAGFLAGGQKFGPGIVSPSLLPDAKGLPGGMTYGKYLAAMRHGQDPDDPKRILQVMPWPAYANLSDHDLYAIYQYLRALPAHHAAARPATRQPAAKQPAAG